MVSRFFSSFRQITFDPVYRLKKNNFCSVRKISKVIQKKVLPSRKCFNKAASEIQKPPCMSWRKCTFNKVIDYLGPQIRECVKKQKMISWNHPFRMNRSVKQKQQLCFMQTHFSRLLCLIVSFFTFTLILTDV